MTKIKEGYLVWLSVTPHMPKSARYIIGLRIENKFLDLLEFSYLAYFSPKDVKIQKIIDCILILDALKFLILTAWEAKFISHKHYEEISLKLQEIGRMFGGWKNNIDHPKKRNTF
ncbi:MAG: four helix bundle protein [Patescibacteria group bacterium]